MKTAIEITKGYLLGYLIAYLIIMTYSLTTYPLEMSVTDLAGAFVALFAVLPLICLFLGIFVYPPVLLILIIPITAVVVISKKYADKKMLFTTVRDFIGNIVSIEKPL